LHTSLPARGGRPRWRLKHRPGAAAAPDAVEDRSGITANSTDPNALFEGGMARLSRGDYRGARAYFRTLQTEHPSRAEEGAFFYAATFFREGNWDRSRHEFKRFIRRFPDSPRLSQVYWHLAMCDASFGNNVRPMAELRYVIRHVRNDPTTANTAASDLRTLMRRRGGIVIQYWRAWMRWCHAR